MKNVFAFAVCVFMLGVFLGGCSKGEDGDSHTACDWDDWVVTRAATCTESGQEARACKKCKKTEPRTIAPVGHNYSEEKQVTRAATCVVAGEKALLCSACDAKSGIEAIAVLGHEMVWDVNTVTCIAGGERSGSCARSGCTHSETGSLSALGHVLTAWAVAVPAVCGTPGQESRYCSRQDCAFNENRPIPAPSHNWGELATVTPATCDQVGKRARICSICEAESNASSIAALGHSMGAWAQAQAPLCGTDGEEKRDCTRSGCEHFETRVVLMDCLIISNAEQLAAFREEVNNGRNFLNAVVTLAQDIQISGTWAPIGTYSSTAANNRPFRGTFDGNSKTISGLTISGLNDYVGLFGHIGQNAVIKDLNLSNVSVMGRNQVGGLVGWSMGTIENVSISGIVDGTGSRIGGLAGGNENGTVKNSNSSADVSGGQYTGGLIGRNVGGTVEKSYATGNIVDTAGDVGGLAGDNSGTITSSYATGSITGNASNIGGLVGLNALAGVINTSYATGNINVFGTNVGGLVGDNDGRIVNCFAFGDVANTNNSTSSWSNIRTGGLVGVNCSRVNNSYSIGNVSAVSAQGSVGGLIGGIGSVTGTSSLIVNSYYNTETSNSVVVDRGTPKTTAEMKQQETFVNWDFTEIWGISPTINNGYPHLRVFQ